MPSSTTLTQALDDVRARSELLPDHGVMRDGLPTGFEELDRVLCGLRPGGVTVVAGAASTGSTSFGVTVARNVVRDGHRSVVWASVDEDVVDVARNFLSSQALIPTDRLRLGTLTPAERERRDEAVRTLTRAGRPGQPHLHGFEVDCNPLDIVAGRDTTLDDVAAAIEQMPHAGLLVVDDLRRLMFNEYDHLAATDRLHVDTLVMGRLAALAADHDLHVIATVRLYRVWARSGRPTASDFGPWHDLHNLADTVLALWREDLRDTDTPEPGILRVSVLRGPVAGHWEGKLAHVLDRRLVANLVRGQGPPSPVR